MIMKGYFTLPKSSEEESHHQMQFSVLLRTLLFWGSKAGSYSSAGYKVTEFLALSTGQQNPLYIYIYIYIYILYIYIHTLPTQGVLNTLAKEYNICHLHNAKLF